MATNFGTDQLTFGVPQAAGVSGLSQRKLWAAIASGDLQAVRLGGRTLIPKGSLLKYLGIDADGNPVPSGASTAVGDANGLSEESA